MGWGTTGPGRPLTPGFLPQGSLGPPGPPGLGVSPAFSGWECEGRGGLLSSRAGLGCALGRPLFSGGGRGPSPPLPGRRRRGARRPDPSNSDPVVGLAGQRPPRTPREYPRDPHLSTPATPTQGPLAARSPTRAGAGLLGGQGPGRPPGVSASSEGADRPCVGVREPLGATPPSPLCPAPCRERQESVGSQVDSASGAPR